MTDETRRMTDDTAHARQARRRAGVPRVSAALGSLGLGDPPVSLTIPLLIHRAGGGLRPDWLEWARATPRPSPRAGPDIVNSEEADP